MTEHTPTPWIIRSQVQQGKNKGGFYLAPNETCSAPAWGSNQANAAFIVKAVNSHDALVKALQTAIRVADEAREVWDKAPDGMKAGKLLIALSDPSLHYRSDISEMHAALASIKERP